MCLCLLEWHWLSFLRHWGDEMIESAWWRQDTLLSGKRGDLGLLCLLLHVLIHLHVRCRDCLYLVLVSRHLFMKWLTPNKWLTELHAIVRPFFRELIVIWDRCTPVSGSSYNMQLVIPRLLSTLCFCNK